MTIGKIQRAYAQRLNAIDIELLIAKTLNTTRETILTHPERELTLSQQQLVEQYISRRLRGEPLAYIINVKEFFGLSFYINNSVLIPRPETELLVELALEKIYHQPSLFNNSAIIDIGTGSGCIIISLAKKLGSKLTPDMYGLDISESALHIAKKNAQIHHQANRITFLKSYLLSSFFLDPASFFKDKTHILFLANLPYLKEADRDSAKNHVHTAGIQFEPARALFSGEDGLNAYRLLNTQIDKLKQLHPKTNVQAFYEIAPTQKEALRKDLQDKNLLGKMDIYEDLSGLTRVAHWYE